MGPTTPPRLPPRLWFLTSRSGEVLSRARSRRARPRHSTPRGAWLQGQIGECSPPLPSMYGNETFKNLISERGRQE